MSFFLFVFGFKIRPTFRYHFHIGTKSLSLGHSFEVCKLPIDTGGQILRIGMVWKQFKVQFIWFCYLYDRLVTRCVVLVKDHFFLLHLWPVFFSFKRGNNAIKYSLFMVLPFSRWSMNIPYTEAENLPADGFVFGRFGRLSPAAVHSVDYRFGVKSRIHDLLHVRYLRKNSFFLCWNIWKQRSESSTRCCFWSTVSKRAPTLNTLPSDISNTSAISHNFNLRLAKTAGFGQPQRSASFGSVRAMTTKRHSIFTKAPT